MAEIIAFVGLIAAFIGALGPAEVARTTYSWPPRTLPAATPSRAWYTPLLLAIRIPETLDARIPCTRPRPLPRAPRPLTVLATARVPERAGGLAVTSDGERFTFAVGDTVLARLPETTDRRNGTACEYRLVVASRKWVLTGPRATRLTGVVERMPVVNGLLSGAALRSSPHVSVDITTQPHGVVTTPRQRLAWIVAVVCALAALILVVFSRPRSLTWNRLVQLPRDAVANATPADACIGVLLLVWWVLSPSFFDDGWTVARQRAFTTTGGFSQFYEAFGVNLPLGYWLEWSQHWLTQSTDALVLLRLPALLCLAATWIVCRWCLAHVLSSSAPGRSVALWALAVGFAAMAMAWGMSFRQEPVVALLVAGVLACCLRFAQNQGPAPIAIAAVLVPLALTAHPAGIVALAPLLVLAPTVLRWARSRPASAVALVTASGALLLMLAFVGSDVEQRASDVRTIREASYTVAGWREEFTRYVALSKVDAEGDSGVGTPLRRASVALMLLAALAYFGRRRGGGATLLDLPATTLALALVLLIATPSKWPWHFGALIAVASLAVAAETARLRAAFAESRGWAMRPLLGVGLLVLGIAWSWSPRNPWNTLDLQTLDWTPALEKWLPLSTLALALPVALLVGGMARAHRRGGSASAVPWQITSWGAVVLAVPLIAFTVGVLALDTARSSTWTPARQNVNALRGRSSCGIAGELLVPRASSMRPLRRYGKAGTMTTPPWVPQPPVSKLPRFALGPLSLASRVTPWFVVPSGPRIGLYVAGEPGPADRLALEWGSARTGRVRLLARHPVELPVEPDRDARFPWRFVAASELEASPPEGTLVRARLLNDADPGAAVAVTAPVAYRSERLERRLRKRGSSALVQPNLVTSVPCAALPRLRDGVVQPPAAFVTTTPALFPQRFALTSPFTGVLDLYDLERLPLADSENPPRSVVVFGVDRRIPGAAIAPPDRVTTVS